MKRLRFFCLLLLLTSCSREAQGPIDLVGGWKLKFVEGFNPQIIHVKNWRMDFKADGTWTYGGDLAGELKDTRLYGSGKWTLRDRDLEFTAEGHGATTTVESLKGTTLVVAPDPVLMGSGKIPLRTTYAKESQP